MFPHTLESVCTQNIKMAQKGTLIGAQTTATLTEKDGTEVYMHNTLTSSELISKN